MNRGGPKPRVLLADDHPDVLDRVAELLAADFDIAGAADGRQALDAARHLDPDVIVLDINMPRLNGFETIRELERAGSRAPVVFLSSLEDEEIVGEAFRRGGRGYVLKRHVTRDLGSALDHVRQGRMFVPSLTPLLHLSNGHGRTHAMQRYRDLATFVDGLAALCDATLRRGDAMCVIATEDVREGLDRRLRERGWNVATPSGHPRYRVIDAAAALHRFMRNGRPDVDRLAEIAAELNQYRLTVTGGTGTLTIFGDMVVSLCAEGNTAAAIELESQWNASTHHLPFLTVCGYHSSCFDAADAWSDAWAQHAAVSHAA